MSSKILGFLWVTGFGIALAIADLGAGWKVYEHPNLLIILPIIGLVILFLILTGPHWGQWFSLSPLLPYYFLLMMFLTDDGYRASIFKNYLSVEFWGYVLPIIVYIMGNIVYGWYRNSIREKEREAAHLRGETYVDLEEKHWQDWKLLHDEAIRKQEESIGP